jgi:hypothetical protein
VESSGWPLWADTDVKKIDYIKENERKWIILNESNIENNPGLRTVSKTLLNSLWGKIAENISNFKETIILFNESEINSLLVDDTKMVEKAIDCTTFIIATYKDLNKIVTSKSNAVVGAHVTALARLYLLDFMEITKSKLLYCDTDSIIFHVDNVEEENIMLKKLKVNEYLGDMKNEFDAYRGYKCTEFICLGPKTYGLKLDSESLSKYIIKSKGFPTMQNSNSFELYKRLVADKEVSEKIPINKFSIDCLGVVKNTDIVKKIRYTFDKRCLLEDGTTIPYGTK